MPTHLALTLVGVTRLPHPDFPIEIDLVAVKPA
jgi:enamine deaminase RidA (YjgF/YER057c/UK114 family)